MTIQIHKSITGCYELVMGQSEEKRGRDISDDVTFSSLLCSTLVIHRQKNPQTRAGGNGSYWLHQGSGEFA